MQYEEEGGKKNLIEQQPYRRGKANQMKINFVFFFNSLHELSSPLIIYSCFSIFIMFYFSSSSSA
jgi:hypothetical protein